MQEDVLLLPDTAAAEKTRRRLVTPQDKLKDVVNGKNVVAPCATDDEAEPSRIPYQVEPFTRDGWTGEMENLAVRRAKMPRDPTYKDSVAHVAVVVRRGTTVVRPSWQGPAGTDLAAAVRAGRTALTRTLDLLPTN
ncbi:hypothetical protein [Nonomuraea jabiensis]|uniref:hypothetical protein n=1 Tax=Nonomuraea jabiensis TaxID=882448 RepID=UPI0036CA0C91